MKNETNNQTTVADACIVRWQQPEGKERFLLLTSSFNCLIFNENGATSILDEYVVSFWVKRSHGLDFVAKGALFVLGMSKRLFDFWRKS